MDSNSRHEGSRPRLVVFAEDWGRHPSSCQDLVKHLIADVDIVWVETIGSRRPRLDRYTLRRGAQKLKDWLGPTAQRVNDLTVVQPFMWPDFGSLVARRINRYLLCRSLAPVLAAHRWTAVAMTPLVADLVDSDLPIDRWTYYCVDDFAHWPGLDSASLAEFETQFIQVVDAVVASSQVLVDRMLQSGVPATLLTHGVDVDSWVAAEAPTHDVDLDLNHGNGRPVVTFWGTVDRRLDLDLIEETSASLDGGSIVFVGPENNPDRRLREIEGVSLIGSVSRDLLPTVAALSDVLIIPYRSGESTEAIQPLKLKEYLATGRPVVTTDLPSVDEWSDCCDVVPADRALFAAKVLERVSTGTPADQMAGRDRLQHERWERKALRFAEVVFGWDEVGNR